MWRPCSWPAVRVCLSLAAGALAFSLPLSLSHSPSLYVTFSFSLCLFLYQSSPLSVNDKVSSTPPTSPPAPVRGRLCSAEDYLAISGMAGRSGQKMSPLFFFAMAIDNIQCRSNKFPTIKFAFFMLHISHVRLFDNNMTKTHCFYCLCSRFISWICNSKDLFLKRKSLH